jgi:hypothetical protein
VILKSDSHLGARTIYINYSFPENNRVNYSWHFQHKAREKAFVGHRPSPRFFQDIFGVELPRTSVDACTEQGFSSRLSETFSPFKSHWVPHKGLKKTPELWGESN